MKKVLFVLCLSLISNQFTYSQYSSYYNVDVNSNSRVTGNVNVNKNVRVSGNTTQTIRTVDYGALAKANAEKERTRLEAQKYADEKAKAQAIEIAENPLKAWDYGNGITWDCSSTSEKRKMAKRYGFKKMKFYVVFPHKSLFVSTGNARWENVSSDGVTTEYILYYTRQIPDTAAKRYAPNEAEKLAKMETLIVGQLNDDAAGADGKIFVHKKDINRTTIFGSKGFRGTLIWEDDYQYTITENYIAIWKGNDGNTYSSFAKVRYYGDKDEIAFLLF